MQSVLSMMPPALHTAADTSAETARSAPFSENFEAVINNCSEAQESARYAIKRSS